MKKILVVLICMAVILCGCGKTENIMENNSLPNENAGNSVSEQLLEKGQNFLIEGIVGYSDEPSDIGQQYCFVTCDTKISYYYTDIYNEKSSWSSEVFYSKGNDTVLLKEYVGRKVKLSGIFDAESHGIPYITNITVLQQHI